MAKKGNPLLIVGNWKMYKTIQDGLDFVSKIAPIAQDSSQMVWIAAPFTAIHPLHQKIEELSSNIVIGAQNMNEAEEGAFTGEIAAKMLKEAGAQFVIIGHSERRLYFKETDQMIHKKLLRALDCSLLPILCIGESQQEKESNKTEEVLKQQLTAALEEIPQDKRELITIAYEPIWAIGTGQAATPEMAEETLLSVRKLLKELWNASQAEKIKLLYGGSVTSKNASEFTKQSAVSGLLVGSAALDPDSFTKIIENTRVLI